MYRTTVIHTTPHTNKMYRCMVRVGTVCRCRKETRWKPTILTIPKTPRTGDHARRPNSRLAKAISPPSRALTALPTGRPSETSRKNVGLSQKNLTFS